MTLPESVTMLAKTLFAKQKNKSQRGIHHDEVVSLVRDYLRHLLERGVMLNGDLDRNNATHDGLNYSRS
jgi:hypothetical protein